MSDAQMTNVKIDAVSGHAVHNRMSGNIRGNLVQAGVVRQVNVTNLLGWPAAGKPLTLAQVGDDPVSIAARNSVVQLADGFVTGGIVERRTAKRFAKALASSLAGDEGEFARRVRKLTKLGHKSAKLSFECMLTSFVFCDASIHVWEEASGENFSFWAEMMGSTDITIPYVLGLVSAARHGSDSRKVPGHPEDQLKVTMNLGMVSALTIELAASLRQDPVVLALQDVLVRVQRMPADADSPL